MTATTQKDLSKNIAEWGWRMETITQPDGTITSIQVPLTSEEFLHPQEGYHLPNSTFHDDSASDAKDMLTRRYANDPETGIFRDLIIKWDSSGLRDNCPDVFIAFGIRNKDQNRTEFWVAEEGARPALIIEVVSPRYRKEDREIKVKQYAKARVPEYIIIDRRRQRNQIIEEVLGYRLVDDQYLPLTPDEEGRILCETIGVWIGLEEGRVVMVDAETGERLLNSRELQQQANQAEQRANQAEQRANQAEQRAIRLEELLRSQGIDPQQV
ncbi:MAG TPA: hypothetical protein DCY91_00575 [Cyanobacteria bacterium UBA11370]|nr:hypothetical protein [Cyanobacteria bacterium UBA11370]HBY80979.1 hypothetical protein [Cyanobacteria bacterium UBA11148]